MNKILRNIVFSLCTTVLFFGSAELYLQHIQYEGTSIADLVDTAGFPDNSYVHKRDRILGPWFLKTPNGYRSNPELRSRGFHKETFLDSEQRIFAIGGSTTYGSPFEHEERGFPHRLQKSLNGKIRVINAGVAGMDSSAFPEMSKELSSIGGEGVIIYTGNNEIRGGLLSTCTKQKENPLTHLRTYQWIQDIYREQSGFQYSFNHLAKHQEDCISESVQHVLSTIELSSTTQREDPFYRKILMKFRNNIVETINTFIKNEMEVWLIIPPINLYASPTHSQTAPYLPLETIQLISSLEQKQDWSSILLLDPTHAGANHHLGTKKENAQLLRVAAEFDYASRRITPSLQKVLLEICEQYENSVQCVDMRYIEEGYTQNFFVDFCHPTFDYGVNAIVQSILPHVE